MPRRCPRCLSYLWNEEKEAAAQTAAPTEPDPDPSEASL